MAAARLRRTFRYATEDDEPENLFDNLDEEQQEKLIATLEAEDHAKNELHRKAFLAVPLLAAGLCFHAAFFLTPSTSSSSTSFSTSSPSSSSARRQRVVALLGMCSLASTAYTLYYQPLETAARKEGGGKAEQEEERWWWRWWNKVLGLRGQAAKGPVEKYLVFVNAGLALLLEVVAVVSWRQGRVEDAWRESLPAIVLVLTLFVRQQLAPLDLEDLQKARYELKGA